MGFCRVREGGLANTSRFHAKETSLEVRLTTPLAKAQGVPPLMDCCASLGASSVFLAAQARELSAEGRSKDADRFHQSGNAQNAHHPFHVGGQPVQRHLGPASVGSVFYTRRF